MRALFDVNVLIALAVKRSGRLVTFDGGSALGAVSGARRAHLEVLD